MLCSFDCDTNSFQPSLSYHYFFILFQKIRKLSNVTSGRLIINNSAMFGMNLGTWQITKTTTMAIAMRVNRVFLSRIASSWFKACWAPSSVMRWSCKKQFRGLWYFWTIRGKKYWQSRTVNWQKVSATLKLNNLTAQYCSFLFLNCLSLTGFCPKL